MILLAALNWHSIFFLLYALTAIAFAVAVVLTSNIVRMAFYLTLCLGATAGLFFLAGAEFVGSMQLLIYVGGTLVLLIFGVMLTAQERFISMKTGGAEWVLAAILGGSLLLLLLQAGYGIDSWNTPRPHQASIPIFEARTSTPIGLALSGVRVDKLDESNELLRRGMSGYLFPFVIISMHLLIVLIGASYMARTKRVGLRSAIEPAPRPVVQNRRHRLNVMGGIVSGVLVNFVLAALAFFYWLRGPGAGGVFGPVNSYLEPAARWLWPLLALLFLANVLLLIVVYGWQRWGVVALVLVTIGQALAIGNSGLPSAWAWIFLIIAMLPVVALVVVLNSRPLPTEWEQME
jgi:NADH-quinone oxidoreductase subunit J